MPLRIIDTTNNQAEQITPPQHVGYSIIVQMFRIVPNSRCVTNNRDNEKTAHKLEIYLASKAVQKLLYSIPIHLALSTVQPPSTEKRNLTLTKLILMSDCKEDGLNQNAMTMQFHRFFFQMFIRKNSFTQFFIKI